jgi:hypothetical protein
MREIINDYIDPKKIEDILSSNFDPYDCSKLIDLTTNTFINKFKGKKCFILGTGYSLNEVDLTQLKNEIILSANNIFLCPDVTPKFWFITSTNLMETYEKSSIAQNFLKRRDITKFIGVDATEYGSNYFDPKLIPKFIYKYPNVFFIRMNPNLKSSSDKAPFLTSMSYPSNYNNFCQGRDVTSSVMIPSSFLMGFNKVFILGVHKRSPVHFYDTTYWRGVEDHEYKQTRRAEFFSAIKSKYFKIAHKYVNNPKGYSYKDKVFRNTFSTHYEVFEKNDRLIRFVHENEKNYDKHDYKKISFREALKA